MCTEVGLHAALALPDVKVSEKSSIFCLEKKQYGIFYGLLNMDVKRKSSEELEISNIDFGREGDPFTVEDYMTDPDPCKSKASESMRYSLKSKTLDGDLILTSKIGYKVPFSVALERFSSSNCIVHSFSSGK